MYNPEAISYAFAAASADRAKALSLAVERKAQAEAELPRLAVISAQLSRIGADIAKSFYTSNPAQSVEALAKQSLNLQNERKQLLKAAGYTADYLEPAFHCKKCADTGRVDGKICSCIRQRAIAYSLAELAKIAPSDKCTFDNFRLDYYQNLKTKSGESAYEEAKSNLEYLKAYCADFSEHSKSLYIFGKTGLGKTHLALAAANAIIKKGYHVVYGMSGAIFASVEEEKFKGTAGRYSMKKLLDADLLIIDDLGSEFHTSFSASVVHNVIESRLLASKPVIITTNLDIGGINRQYGERIASRIIGEYEPIKFEGEDIRQRKRFQY